MNSANRTTFDASALLALLLDEPGADRLRERQPDAVISAVNTAEVLAKLVSRGVPLPEAQSAIDALHMDVVPFDAVSASISGKFVRKGVSLGDRCFLAAAIQTGGGWTSDRELAAVAGGMIPNLQFFR